MISLSPRLIIYSEYTHNISITVPPDHTWNHSTCDSLYCLCSVYLEYFLIFWQIDCYQYLYIKPAAVDSASYILGSNSLPPKLSLSFYTLQPALYISLLESWPTCIRYSSLLRAPSEFWPERQPLREHELKDTLIATRWRSWEVPGGV